MPFPYLWWKHLLGIWFIFSFSCRSSDPQGIETSAISTQLSPISAASKWFRNQLSIPHAKIQKAIFVCLLQPLKIILSIRIRCDCQTLLQGSLLYNITPCQRKNSSNGYHTHEWYLQKCRFFRNLKSGAIQFIITFMAISKHKTSRFCLWTGKIWTSPLGMKDFFPLIHLAKL